MKDHNHITSELENLLLSQTLHEKQLILFYQSWDRWMGVNCFYIMQNYEAIQSLSDNLSEASASSLLVSFLVVVVD